MLIQPCALPLCDKVHGELNHIEKEGVISKFDGPTTWWCAWMVVASAKKSVATRICIDCKQNVLRELEVHPHPQMDETLALLLGATVISKPQPTMDFGRSHSPKNYDCWPPSSCLLANIVSINYHLVLPVRWIMLAEWREK